MRKTEEQMGNYYVCYKIDEKPSCRDVLRENLGAPSVCKVSLLFRIIVSELIAGARSIGGT